MLNKDNSYATSLSLSATSNVALSNPATAITSLVVTPLLEIVLLVAVIASSGISDVRDVAYSGIILTFGLAVLSGTVGQVTYDRQVGAMREIVSYGIWNPRYWFGKLAIPMLLGVLPAFFSAITVYFVDGSSDSTILFRALALIPLAAVVGAVVGVTASIASFALSDPYLVSNIAHPLFVITSGVVLPLNLYPSWLVRVSRFLPFTATIEALRSPTATWPFVFRELFVTTLWLVLGIIIANRVLALLRSGLRREEIW